MIYQSGTTTGTSQTLAYGGEVGLIGASAKTKSQSVLAQRVVPPIKPEFSLSEVLAVGAIIAIIIFTSIGLLAFGLHWILVILIALAATGGVVYFTIQKINSVEKAKYPYERALTIWQNSWMCLKCGYNWSFNPLKNKKVTSHFRKHALN